ncbi:MAG: 16S rRNA (uracil(1498)-N(3))-methyltransferase [Pontiellaceae bacterium]|nr:16S rRNA (uracil(1498)-N(3))-methyltransferase [Pontiellaceae bacterium]MBN2784239.1 16S rRNA (uracil(1498)-N(3))-methyltransferase [Pontiellaceae bacterium]
MNMILIQSNEVDAGGMCCLSDDRARHIRKVLGGVPGKSLRVGLQNGPLGQGMIENIENGQVTLSCTFDNELPQRPSIDLLLAMPRPKVMKRLWAQLAALGVGRIVLLRAEKVERYYFDSHVIDPDFYTPLLQEGLQQARCTHLPEVSVHPLFKPFVEDELEGLFGGHDKLLADPAGTLRLSACMKKIDPARRIVLSIGPEGGWTPYELDHFHGHGFKVFGMGHRILRSDTAVIGLLSIMNELKS